MTARVTLNSEEKAIRAMARFGLSVFERHRNYGDPGDIDGGAAEMDAICLGLLRWEEDKDAP